MGTRRGLHHTWTPTSSPKTKPHRVRQAVDTTTALSAMCGEWYFAERVIVVYHADERLAELLSADS